MTLRRLILHNFWLKLVSILLASLLWLVVQVSSGNEENFAPRFFRPSKTREVVRPVLILTDMSIGRGFKVEPREVSVEISGPGAQQIQANDIHAFVELIDPVKMKGEMPFKVLVRAPSGLKLGRVHPESVVIRPVEAP
jgi:hypothetical protein